MAATPQAFVLEVTGHVLLARVLGVVAELGLADRVSEAPKTPAELAAETGVTADALYRLLRMLAAHGVFAEDDAGRFKLTPRAEILQADRPGSVHPLLRRDWQDLAWDTLKQLPTAVRTGTPAFELAHGMEFFDFLARHPAANTAFDRAMALVADVENPVIAAALDLDGVTRVVDVGGGRGDLLAALLRREHRLQGVLYDQEQVIADPAGLRDAGLLERCTVQAGDFFTAVPAGADLYVLKRILHDWNDDRAVIVLTRCREAMGAASRIAVIDAVMRPGNDPDPNKSLDVSIMTLTRGRERTEAEFAALFERAGLALRRIVATPAPSTLSIVEGEIARLE